MLVRKYFRFEQLQTDFKRETVAGVTTFMTMAYIVIVNPKILQAAGIPLGPSMVATVLAAFFGTLIELRAWSDALQEGGLDSE